VFGHARYGGDEFVLLLPRYPSPNTPPPDAHAITGRIRQRIANLRWEHAGQTITVGVGIGLSTAGSGSSISTLLAESDAKLYDAKTARSSGAAELEITI